MTAAPRLSQSLTVIDSDVLGELVVSPTSIIDFPAGLLGFPECTRFVLLAIEDREGLYWLQSMDSSALTFVLADPFIAVPGFALDLPDITAAELHARTPESIVVLAFLTLPDCPHAPFTANLQGPLAINPLTRRGMQLVLADSEHGTRTPVDLSRCR